MHNKDEKQTLDTYTKIGIIVIIGAIIGIYSVISVQLNMYVKAVIVLILIGLIIKLAERVIIDVYNMWDIFDFWRRLRRQS
jgi:hypothetical protein